jgi:DNA-binding NarL/FixJ family response regulator
MTVFLVEDALLLRTRLEAMIASIPGAQSAGHADGADAAIGAIMAVRPDVVVLDLHLKQGHGIHVLQTLHQQAPQVAVYVITNYPSDTYRAVAERFGARGFFDKSHEFDKLRAALCQAAL